MVSGEGRMADGGKNTGMGEKCKRGKRKRRRLHKDRLNALKTHFFRICTNIFPQGGAFEYINHLTFPKLHIKAPYTLISSCDDLGSYIFRIHFGCVKNIFFNFFPYTLVPSVQEVVAHSI